MKFYSVQFICYGNTFRSRLAEAYLKSKQYPNLKVSSSGIKANLNYNGNITQNAEYIIHKYHLTSYSKKTWDLTNQKMIDDSDMIIALDKSIEDYIYNKFDLNNKKVITWSIQDIGTGTNKTWNTKHANEIIQTEKIYKTIRDKVDSLQLII